MADYCISEVLLAPITERVFSSNGPSTPSDGDPANPQEGPSIPPEFLEALSKGDPGEFEKSPAAVMQGLLDYLDQRFGGVMPYLRDVGVTEETIEKIREKFLEEP